MTGSSGGRWRTGPASPPALARPRRRGATITNYGCRILARLWPGGSPKLHFGPKRNSW